MLGRHIYPKSSDTSYQKQSHRIQYCKDHAQFHSKESPFSCALRIGIKSCSIFTHLDIKNVIQGCHSGTGIEVLVEHVLKGMLLYLAHNAMPGKDGIR